MKLVACVLRERCVTYFVLLRPAATKLPLLLLLSFEPLASQLVTGLHLRSSSLDVYAFATTLQRWTAAAACRQKSRFTKQASADL